ncbi:P-loop containing nucleoside triphosphate hydrolase protein [Periconia macrospinosa]|uniref:P-loop containing nucleoside triphosphate hydrolase protein n=1 Tax=Periconia macrospinosa TaxID=97972 RepID=A0A2V1DFX3_9PLEO|nr:P-loop containing nucleoside triphosphate hydrolase protein [Periconia macrospinosa]
MEDLEKWLSVKNRQHHNSIGVMMNNLNVTGQAASNSFQRTFASYILLLPTRMMNFVRVDRKNGIPIRREIFGLVRGGEMLLVLGRPGAGCTTFLKTISGHTHGFAVDESPISYNGIPYRDMHKLFPKDTLYQAEEDSYLPELTLEQTLAFAAKMRPDETNAAEISRWIATIFNLQDVVKDRIGNHIIRGLSGGETRRTTLAETFISNSRIQCWDNSTRGLDSDTALRFIRILRKSADVLGSVILLSIYQASETIYSRFDKVLLLYEGRQIYCGSTAGASEYFHRLGYCRPTRATTADFLTSMTHPSERVPREGYERWVPRTPDEFAASWKASNTVVAIILGSVFYNLEENTESFESRSVLLFYSIMVNSCVPAFEVLTMWAQRPIVEKHSRYVLYHPFTEGIASMIADLPNKVLTSLFFNTCLYFMANLRRSAIGFFIFWLYSFVAMVTMSMIFRMVGSLSRTYEQSMAPVATMIFNFIIYAGFVIPPAYQVPWLGYQKSRLWSNLGFLFLLMAIFGGVHLIAAEFILAQRSKGDILLFLKNRGSRKSNDEEKGDKTAYPAKARQSIQRVIHEKKDLSNTLNQTYPAFHWQNLSYKVKPKGGDFPRVILDEITGWVEPGTLTALMGVTGAGKTSLLDVLADRKTVGVISGEIYVGNQQRHHDFQGRTGYVQQADLHVPTATVREALVFSAFLRQRNGTPTEKLAYVESVLDLLEMHSYADAIIGVPGKGLNVEQRKRLTIAVEMAAKSDFLLFLDEPTSGLDSQTAWSICKLLRKLADNGLAIMCTIHQPSAQLFEMFDQLLLLGKGKTLYFGSIGNDSVTLVKYFESHGARLHQSDENPAEWLLEVTNSSPSSWADVWKTSKELVAVNKQLSFLKTSKFSSTGYPEASNHTRGSAASFSRQLFLVTSRTFKDYWRDPTYLYSKLALCIGAVRKPLYSSPKQKIIILTEYQALFNGLSFLNTAKDIQSVINILFSCFLLTIIFSTIDQQIIPRFLNARSLFEAREAQSKTYSWSIFLVANIIVEVFWQTIAAIFVFLAWYFPIGLWRNTDTTFPWHERVGLMFLLLWLFFVFTPTLCQALAAGMEDAQTVVNIAQLLWTLALIFCGILIAPADLPKFWKFMYRVSPATYLVNGMVIAGIANTNITCSSTELLHIELPHGWVGSCSGYVVDEVHGSGRGCMYCALTDVNHFLMNRDVNASDGWKYAGLFSLLSMYQKIGVDPLVSMYIYTAHVTQRLNYWPGSQPKWKRRKALFDSLVNPTFNIRPRLT